MEKKSLGVRQVPIYTNDQFRNYYDVGDIDDKDIGEDVPIQETPNLFGPNNGLTAPSTYVANKDVIEWKQIDKEFRFGEKYWLPTYGNVVIRGYIGTNKRIVKRDDGATYIIPTEVIKDEVVLSNTLKRAYSRPRQLTEFVDNSYGINKGYNWKNTDPVLNGRDNWMGGDYQTHNFKSPINEEQSTDNGYTENNPRNYPKVLKNNDPQEKENLKNFQINKYPSGLNLHGY